MSFGPRGAIRLCVRGGPFVGLPARGRYRRRQQAPAGVHRLRVGGEAGQQLLRVLDTPLPPSPARPTHRPSRAASSHGRASRSSPPRRYGSGHACPPACGPSAPPRPGRPPRGTRRTHVPTRRGQPGSRGRGSRPSPPPPARRHHPRARAQHCAPDAPMAYPRAWRHRIARCCQPSPSTSWGQGRRPVRCYRSGMSSCPARAFLAPSAVCGGPAVVTVSRRLC